MKTIKSGPHRTVSFVQMTTGSIYIKHFRTPDWRSMLLNAVRGSRAELELQAVQTVAAAGIPTYEPLALGRRYRGGLLLDSYLVSQAIPASIPLDEFVIRELPKLDAATQSRVRKLLASQLGEISAQLHEAGLMHRDYHAGNLLLTGKLDSLDLKLWLIDLHSVHSSGRCPADAAVRANLLQLHPFFARRISRAERLRFLHAYWSARNVPQAMRAEAMEAAAIAQFSRELARDEVQARQKRDRKWARGNRRLRIMNAVNVDCRGLSIVAESDLAEFRDNPEQLYAEPSLRFHLQRGPVQRSAGIAISTSEGILHCVVQSASTSWTGIAWSLRQQRWTPGRKAWELGFAISRRGIPTPRPLLYIEKYAAGQLETHVVYEQVELGRSLQRFLQAQRPRSLSAPVERALAENLAALVGALVRQDFLHTDLSLQHFLVEGDQADGTLWLTRPQDVKRRRISTVSQLSGMLAPLELSARHIDGISLRQRFIFLSRLLKEAGLSLSWKAVWRETGRRAQVLQSRPRPPAISLATYNPWCSPTAPVRRSA